MFVAQTRAMMFALMLIIVLAGKVAFAPQPNPLRWTVIPLAIVCAAAVHYIISHAARQTILRVLLIAICWLAYSSLTAEFIVLQAVRPSIEDVPAFVMPTVLAVPIVFLAAILFIGFREPPGAWPVAIGMLLVAGAALPMVINQGEFEHVVAGGVLVGLVSVFFGTCLGILLDRSWNRFIRRNGPGPHDLGRAVRSQAASASQRLWDMLLLLALKNQADEMRCCPVAAAEDVDSEPRHADDLLPAGVTADDLPPASYRLTFRKGGKETELVPPPTDVVSYPLWLMHLARIRRPWRRRLGQTSTGRLALSIAERHVDLKAVFTRIRLGEKTVLHFPPHELARPASQVLTDLLSPADSDNGPFHFDAPYLKAAAILTGQDLDIVRQVAAELWTSRLAGPSHADLKDASRQASELATLLGRITTRDWQSYYALCLTVPLENVAHAPEAVAALIVQDYGGSRWTVINKDTIQHEIGSKPVILDEYLGFGWSVDSIVMPGEQAI
jgi:hypothetical protein